MTEEKLLADGSAADGLLRFLEAEGHAPQIVEFKDHA